MTIRAVLFDVGGPIDTEVQHEILVEAYLRQALLAVGVNASAEAVQAASEWAVQAFAPYTYQAMLWQLCGADVKRAAEAQRLFSESSLERRSARGGLELRPGIDAVIRA